MTPAPSSGPRLGGGAVETHGSEERVDENQDRCRVTENMQMAVGAGDIPGTTDMGSILGRSSEPSTETALSQCAAGTLGRAPQAVWGPVMLTSSLPFSQPAASGPGAAQISRESERAGAGALGHDETVGEAQHDGVPTTARVPDTAPMVPTTARVPDTAPMKVHQAAVVALGDRRPHRRLREASGPPGARGGDSKLRHPGSPPLERAARRGRRGGRRRTHLLGMLSNNQPRELAL